VSNQLSRALFGVSHAFQVGRLVIVDAECYERMGVAFNNFAELQRALKGSGEMAPTQEDVREKIKSITSRTRGLNDDVFALVSTGQDRLSPVQTRRNKRRRARVQKELDAKYFELRDLGATF
jgi:hypothetical protein